MTVGVYFVNLTPEARTLSVYRAKEPLDCGTIGEAPNESTDGVVFELEQCIDAAPLELVSLDRNPGATAILDEGVSDAVVLRIADAPDTALCWSGVSRRTIGISGGGTGLVGVYHAIHDEHSIVLEDAGDRLVLAPGENLSSWSPRVDSLEDATCDGT